MAEFIAGPTAILTWTTSAGTFNLAADYRTFSWNPSIDYVETSAGSDTQKGRLTALKDATANVTLVGQTSGTAIVAALQPGQAGTLIFGPEGTATNKRKITFPAYADGAVTDAPYADIVTLTCGFTGGGAILANYTDGVY